MALYPTQNLLGPPMSISGAFPVFRSVALERKHPIGGGGRLHSLPSDVVNHRYVCPFLRPIKPVKKTVVYRGRRGVLGAGVHLVSGGIYFSVAPGLLILLSLTLSRTFLLNVHNRLSIPVAHPLLRFCCLGLRGYFNSYFRATMQCPSQPLILWVALQLFAWSFAQTQQRFTCKSALYILI